MSAENAIVTGIRLLRAVFEAQREFDYWQRKDFRSHGDDAAWCEARDALKAAKAALHDFETGQSEDFKHKQAGDR